MILTLYFEIFVSNFDVLSFDVGVSAFPRPSEKGTTKEVSKTLNLQMAQLKARIWP